MLQKLIDAFIIKDVKTKRPSYTVTAFVIGFFVVNLKLIISGITVGSIMMSEFTGIDYAAAVAALGTIYVMRKNATMRRDFSVKKEYVTTEETKEETEK